MDGCWCIFAPVSNLYPPSPSRKNQLDMSCRATDRLHVYTPATDKLLFQTRILSPLRAERLSGLLLEDVKSEVIQNEVCRQHGVNLRAYPCPVVNLGTIQSERREIRGGTLDVTAVRCVSSIDKGCTAVGRNVLDKKINSSTDDFSHVDYSMMVQCAIHQKLTHVDYRNEADPRYILLRRCATTVCTKFAHACV